jgi:hypothetical protein
VIYLSAILVVLAFGLLVAGVVTGTAVLVMWSIVVSVLSAVFLMIGALLRRHELFPSGGTPAATAPPMPSAGAGVAGGMMGRPGAVASSAAPPRGASSQLVHPLAAPHTMHQTATLASPRGFPSTAARGPSGAGGISSPDAIVLVIPGRKRLHLSGCRQLAGRETEELTYEEAREEGFTACTTCLPDGYKPDTAYKSEAGRTTETITRTPEPGRTSDPGVRSEAGRASEVGHRSEAGRTSETGGKPEIGDKPDSAHKSETARKSGTGHKSEETRPVTQVPAESAMESTEKTPGRAGPPVGSSTTSSPPSTASPTSSTAADAERSDGGQASTWRSEAWFAARSSGSSASKPAQSPPADTASSKPGDSPSSSKRPGASAEPIAVPAPPIELPEAVTPFQAFKRSDSPKPPASTGKSSTGEAKPGEARPGEPSGGKPGEPGGGRPRTTPSDASGASAGKPGAVGKKPVAAPDDDDEPVVVVSGSSRPADAPRKPDSTGKSDSTSKLDTIGKSNDSGKTNGSGNGSETGEPVAPAKSAEPAKSARPGNSAGPEKAAGSAKITDSVKSPKPAKAGEPGKSSAPGRSSAPDTSTTALRSEGSTEAAPKPAPAAERPLKPAAGGGSTQAASPVDKPRDAQDKPKDAGDRSMDAGDRSRDAHDKPRKSEPTVEVMRPGIVKVISGTRRYHSSACPMIKASDPGTLETMSRADAEAAGLTHCSVCDRDD